MSLAQKTIVITPSNQDGVELRRSLVRRGAVLFNVYTETLVGLAEKRLGDRMYKGWRFLDQQTGGELMLQLLAELQREGELTYYKEIAINAMTAKAILRTIVEVKLSHPAGDTVDFTAFVAGKKAEDLQKVLERYNALLEQRKLLDRASTLALALANGSGKYNDNTVYYIPEHLRFYPLEETWLEHLTTESEVKRLSLQQLTLNLTGGEVTWGDDKNPTVRIIRGYGENNEARQLLREIKRDAYPLDECLVCCIDYLAYAEIFYNLSMKYDIPMTYAGGITISHTIPGRLAWALLRWVQKGYRACDFREVLFGGGVGLGMLKQYFLPKVMEKLQKEHTQVWQLIETAEVKRGIDPKNEATRSLEKMLSAGQFFALVSALLPSRDVKENEEKFAAIKQLKQEECESESAKAVPEQKKKKTLLRELANIIWLELFFAEFSGADRGGTLSLAEAFTWFLKNFLLQRYKDKEEKDIIVQKLQHENSVRDHAITQALLEMLSRLAADAFSDDDAQNLLIDFLQSTRVAASGSRPGQIHITPLDKGIWTWRKHVAIVGLDARRFPGMPAEDPILLDIERQKIFINDCPEHLLKKNRPRVKKEHLKMLIDLHGRGSSTQFFSFSSFSPSDSKEILPAAELLEVYKKAGRKTGPLTYAQFDQGFSTGDGRLVQAGFYPAAGEAFLDETDFWLGHAKKGGSKLNETIMNLYSSLTEAARVVEARRSSKLGSYDGKITPLITESKEDIFIGWKNEQYGFSPSSLEVLGECPFRFFMQYILRVNPLDSRVEGMNVWLNPGERGTLLHDVIEEFFKDIYNIKKEFSDEDYKDEDKFPHRISEIALSHLEKKKTLFRPENGYVYTEEKKAFLDICLFFLELEHIFNKEYKARIKDNNCEEKFKCLPLELNEGKLILTGRIDRVVKLSNGEKGEHMLIIDYKSSNSDKFKGIFCGGRKLQAILYALAYEVKGSKVDESRYVFLKSKSKDSFISHSVPKIKDAARQILNHLYLIIRKGEFVVTDEEDDCKYCVYLSLCSRNLLENITDKREQLHAKEVRINA